MAFAVALTSTPSVHLRARPTVASRRTRGIRTMAASSKTGTSPIFCNGISQRLKHRERVGEPPDRGALVAVAPLWPINGRSALLPLALEASVPCRLAPVLFPLLALRTLARSPPAKLP